MKKIHLLCLSMILIITLVSCTQTGDKEVDDALVATQVSIMMTQSALEEAQETETSPSETPLPSSTSTVTPESATPTPTATQTPTTTASEDQSNPAVSLGEPAWTQDFNAASSPWDFDSPQATFATQDGTLTLTAKANPNWHSWYMSSPKLKNAYVEAAIQMSTCSGLDRFGLAVRSRSDGQQFYFMAITCAGQWGFFRMDPDVNIVQIRGFESAEPLDEAINKPHRLGIWMEGTDFKFYIDGKEVGSASDNTLSGEGFTGFLIAFANTPGFSVKVDQLRYWNLP